MMVGEREEERKRRRKGGRSFLFVPSKKKIKKILKLNLS
jgi:hypothetical protein